MKLIAGRSTSRYWRWMRWYFSRPTSDGDTAFEQAVFDTFAPLHLENPNKDLHRTGYSRHGIEYLFFAISILPAYDACICCKLPNGMWSAGVTREVSWFLKHRRMVIELTSEPTETGWRFHLEPLTVLDMDRILSVEQTRALVHHYQTRPDGGRRLPDDQVGPTWKELGLPEPVRSEAPLLY